MNDHIHLLLLEILSDVISAQVEKQDSPHILLDKESVRKLIEDGIHHSVFPLVMDSLFYDNRTRSPGDPRHRAGKLHELYRSEIIHQAEKTADFILFYEYLAANNLHPLLLKGIICRSLYPQPEHRASSDEDLLIDPAEFDRYHETILSYGLVPVDPSADIWKVDEVSYEGKDSHLYIEVHKTPFDTDAKAYADLNSCFDGVIQRGITQEIYGTVFHTLDYTDHLLYLILHAFKHFLSSGFGIRQVCDILLFSENYGNHIDWVHIKKQLQRVAALDFARAIFKIGKTYLLKESRLYEYLTDWDHEQIDEVPLLADIMTGGIYGVEDVNRAHAANITLDAVVAEKSGSRKKGISRSIFLPLKTMQKRYPYLQKLPFLLPVAWGQRVWYFLTEKDKNSMKSSAASPAESLRIGKERIELLKKYQILK